RHARQLHLHQNGVGRIRKIATRTFGDVSFRRVAVIELETDGKGQIVQDSHALPRHVQLNRHAAGPFCRLRIGPLPTSSGVYAIVVGEEVKYVGRCEDLAQRFGPRGYGVIHPRNLHRDGQSANCNINSRILTESRARHSIAIFFHESEDHYREIEAELISILAPPWNDRRERVTRLSESAGKVKTPALGRRDGVHKERFAAGLNETGTLTRP